MLSSIVDSAVAQAETVFDTVERGRQRWIEGREEVVVRDSSILGTRDVRLCSPAQGRCATRQVEWHSYVVLLPSAVAVYTGADAYFAAMPLRARTTPTVPALTRARPSAYIIPRGWADVAERLRGLGLQVETIENPFEGEVETLKVESVSFGQTYYEGASLPKLGNDPRRKPDTTHPACPPSHVSRCRPRRHRDQPAGPDGQAAREKLPRTVSPAKLRSRGRRSRGVSAS
jgi:hypothetical protein